MLCALDFLIGQPKEFVITGKKNSREFQAMLKEIRQTLIPNKVIAYNPDGQDSLIELIPMLKDKSSIGKAVIVYVCQNYTCQMPVMDVESLKTLLE